MHVDFATIFGKARGQGKPLAFLDDGRFGLVRQAQNSHLAAAVQQPAGRRSETLDLVAIQTVGRFGKVRPGAEAARQMRERDVVPRETRAAVTQRTLEIFFADAAVGAQRPGHDVYVRPGQPLTDIGKHVGV